MIRVPSSKIYVMHTAGEMHHPELRDLYLRAAQILVGSGDKYKRFDGTNWVLEMKTSYEYRSLVFIFGVEFEATFHCEHGMHTMKFIVQSYALEKSHDVVDYDLGFFCSFDPKITTDKCEVILDNLN